MNSNSADVIIRLIAKDEGLKEALKSSGKQGEKFVKQLEAAGEKGGAGLKAVDNVAKDVKGSMNGLLQRLGPVGSALKGLGPIGFGAAAGLGAIVVGATAAANAGEQAAKSIAAIGDAADEIGLSTDTYQTYVAVVKEGRVETTALEAALRAAAKTTAEAALGTGELYSNLVQVNPEMVKQIQLADSLEDRLDAVANLYNAAGSEVERSTILLRTFGDNGVRAGKLILESGGDVSAAKKKYEELGLVLSDDLIRASQDAAGEIELANARIKVSQDRLKIAFADFSVGAKDALADFFTFLSKNAGVKSTSEQIDELNIRLEELIEIQDRATNSVQFQGRVAKQAIIARDESIARIKQEIQALKERTALSELASDLDAQEAAELKGLTALKAALNRLREEAKTASEREAEALIDLNAAREKGLISSDAEYNRLRALIAEKYKDVTAIREQEKALREQEKAQQDAQRALEKGLEIRLKLTDARQRGLAITEKVAAFQKDLTDNMRAYGLTQEQVTLAVNDYRNSLDGTAQAQQTLTSALAETLDPIARFTAETERLEALQTLANIPAEDFNRILASRAKLLTELETKEREQSETDQFGETLESAEKRIKDSLKTASEIIDEKVEFQRKIVEALGSKLSTEEATRFLKEYRKELEEAEKKTDDLTDSQERWIDLINGAAGGFEKLGQVALKVLDDIIRKQIEAQNQDGGGGGLSGILSGVFNGVSNLFGGGSTTAEVNHSGKAQVGAAGGARRTVPSSVFAGAQRFHSGTPSLRANEVPAILERGERVTTESDSRALVNAINASTAMSLSAANDRRGGGGGGGMSFTLINNGPPLDAETEDNGEDLEGNRELIVTLNRIVDERVPAALTKGPARDVLSTVYGVRRQTGGAR